MRFGQIFLGFALVFGPAAAEDRQASLPHEHLSTLRHGVESAYNSINSYQGGAIAAIPAGRGLYKVWNSMTLAISNLNEGDDLSPEDVGGIMYEV